MLIYATALTLAPAVRLRTWAVEFRWQHWLGVVAWVVVFWFAQWMLARRLPEFDPFLLPAAALLTGWGQMTIFRLAPGFGLRQAAWLVVAGTVFILGLHLKPDLSVLRRFKYIWLTVGLLLTAATLVFGTNPMGIGPRLWLGCCGLYLQPSEPLKLLLVIFLSAYLADRIPQTKSSTSASAHTRLSLFALSPTLILTGLALLLLIAQRDLGTASIFLILYTGIIYIATSDWRVLLINGIALAAAGVVGYASFDVVQLRIEAWLNPWLDPSGRSYQIVQSLLAVANGGLVGRGPGLGNPGLVPVPQSDFIFAAITEEFGLLGSLGMLVLMGLLIERGLRLALLAPDAYRRLLAAGLTFHLGAQSIFIIGGNLRLLPLTGVTLPFVSYGGSSLLVTFIELLCLVLISSADADQGMPAAGLRVHRQLALGLLVGLTAIGLSASWWGFWRGPDLINRTDNARRSIADRYVKRGSILDRNNQALAESHGQPGDYLRVYSYPALGPIVGYTHPVYGQAGLEASLDDYLRGLQGNPAYTIWQDHLLYGMPPPGLDVRLSLDLRLQQAADTAMGDVQGALVLLNAQSGEIFAMATHPTFDANTLELDRETLLSDPSAPLFDRTTSGLYPPGTALGPFLLAEASATNNLTGVPATLTYKLNDRLLGCALVPPESTWGGGVASGCPQLSATLANALGSQDLLDLLDRLGLFTAPQIRLPTFSGERPDVLSALDMTVLGQSDPQTGYFLSASPLQMALAAAALSNQGLRPAPLLVVAVDTPQSGWVMLPRTAEPVTVFSASSALFIVGQLADPEMPIWQTVGCTLSEDIRGVCWYLGGTRENWPGAPLAIAVLIENADPNTVLSIGRGLLTTALAP